MKEQARLTLERVIRILDREVPPEREHGWWKAQAEQLRPDDEDRLSQFLFNRDVVFAGTKGVQHAVQKILIGENILTPSLVTRGWMFWKQSLLTESEKKAVESAVVRCAESQTKQIWSMKDTFDKLPNKDAWTAAVMLASLLDVTFSCIQQLSTDLKEILLRAKTE